MFFFKILPGVRVIIVNPETRGPLGDSHLGEVSSGKVEAQLDELYFLMLHLLSSLFTTKMLSSKSLLFRSG